MAVDVEDAMHRDPVTCGPDDTVELVATLMHDNEVPASRSWRTAGWSASSPGVTSCGPSSPAATRGRSGPDVRPGPGRPRAVAHDVGLLVERAAPAAVCAVVKADGYGHGAVPWPGPR